jgi:two-component system, cell cycle response regulator DivK
MFARDGSPAAAPAGAVVARGRLPLLLEPEIVSGAAAGRHSASPSAAAESGPPPPVDRRHARPIVLFVDDLEDQRELYRQYLQFAGFDVVVAHDGYEAVDRALRMRPDVVIMDLAMPGLDGFETTQRLKVLEATRGIPVIALTAHGTLPREWALSAGCAAYVRKPCYPHDLAEEIASVLQMGHSARPTSVSPSPEPLRAHVLVVGGGVAERELYAEYFEYRGCVVSVTLEGRRAVPDALRLRPRVIVLDLDAPRPSGWSILRDLRRDPGTRDIAVIGLAREAGDTERGHARALGADLLEKPCAPEALYREIKTAIGGGNRD